MHKPLGNNADEWHAFLAENVDALPYVAVQIAEAIDEAHGRYLPSSLAERAFGILHRFATENRGWKAFFRRWYFSDEPLRNDAANLVRTARFEMYMPEGTRLVGDIE